MPGRDGAIDLRTVFFLASLTKGIVATAVMRYVDEARLDLHVPLARYLPELAGTDAGAVTAWQVLTHTSGLPDMPAESMRQERPTYERAAGFVRGSGSGAGHGLQLQLCLVHPAVRAHGRPQRVPPDEALALRLTEPLGMDDTTFDARPLRGRVLPVQGIGADNRVVQEVLMRFLAAAHMPGGGMFGTLGDLLRLGRALLPADPRQPAPGCSRRQPSMR